MGEACKRKIENARVGYQAAVNLTIHEEQALWNRCSAMLVANGILVAAASFALEKGIKIKPWSVPLIYVLS